MHFFEIIFFLVSHRLEVIQKGPEVKRADTVSQWINRYPVISVNKPYCGFHRIGIIFSVNYVIHPSKNRSQIVPKKICSTSPFKLYAVQPAY